MDKPHSPARILFVGDGNADNALMAEALLKARAGNRFEVYSAGIEPQPISPLAFRALAEIGINIPGRPASDLNEYQNLQFSHVISICEQAGNQCLNFPRDGDVMHWQLADPSAATGTLEEKVEAYREARDALAARVEAWLMM